MEGNEEELVEESPGFFGGRVIETNNGREKIPLGVKLSANSPQPSIRSFGEAITNIVEFHNEAIPFFHEVRGDLTHGKPDKDLPFTGLAEFVNQRVSGRSIDLPTNGVGPP
jgi:hypothetical protein